MCNKIINVWKYSKNIELTWKFIVMLYDFIIYNMLMCFLIVLRYACNKLQNSRNVVCYFLRPNFVYVTLKGCKMIQDLAEHDILKIY
jgi:hypothetical protein